MMVVDNSTCVYYKQSTEQDNSILSTQDYYTDLKIINNNMSGVKQQLNNCV